MLMAFRVLKNGLLLLLCFLAYANSFAHAAQWAIPLAGNTFLTSPNIGRLPTDGSGERQHLLAWKDSDEVFSIYFHVDRAAEIELAVNARVPQGHSQLEFMFDKKAFQKEVAFQKEMKGTELREHSIGRITVAEAGYCRIDLKGIKRTGELFTEVKDLIVASETEGVKVSFVNNNEGGMFYWGRRGPSVHLRYEVPQNQQCEFAYSEITVPEGYDPIGSYFMANGFSQGYFGIQVNSDKERRVLFSVWSPFKTDNPKDIPPDQKIIALGHGPDVQMGEFGNEGSGGQSYLRYPWKAGVRYRFLTQIKPDGKGNTIYAAWFSEADAKQWRLIAKFQRPYTNTHVTGFHSFLENFDPNHGHLERCGHYSNQWVRGVNGTWYECTSSRFSVDPTGRDRHRLDFSGGSDGDHFYLRNGGFFHEPVEIGAKFRRDSNKQQMPGFDIESLP
ncbi:MAG: DUF3472 domain-containing protein [Planctomycetota bacterium]|nr:DUF3472 domain-containing protein [Planctomycetota bacterium]